MRLFKTSSSAAAVSLIIFLALAMTFYWNWERERDLHRALAQHQYDSEVAELGMALSDILGERLNDLLLLQEFWRLAGSRRNMQYFSDLAEALIDREPSYYLINFLDTNSVVQVSIPPERDPRLLKRDLKQLPRREKQHREILRNGHFLCSPPMELLSGRLGMVIWVPAVSAEASQDYPEGLLAGVFHLEDLIQRALQRSIMEPFGIRVSIDSIQVLNTVSDQHVTTITASRQELILGQTWILELLPHRDLVKQNHQLSAIGGLVFNLVLALLIAILAYFLLWDARRLQVSEARFKSFFNTIHDSVMIHSPDGQFIEVNDSALARLGYTRAELLTNHFGIIDPDLYQTFITDRKFQLQGIKVQTFESTHITRSGERIPVELSTTPIQYEGGRAVLVVARDISRRKEAEAKLLDSLKQQEALLGEIHHRVKNNLNIMASLLNMQLNESTSQEAAVDALRKSKDRIFVMAQIHSQLYQSQDLNHIDFAEFVRQMVLQLQQTYLPRNKQIDIQQEIKCNSSSITDAVPMGLILNELVTNALKHAFVDRERGVVTVRITSEGERCIMQIRDDGCGLPVAVDPEKPETLGLRLVHLLVEQMHADFHFAGLEGCCFTFTFKTGVMK